MFVVIITMDFVSATVKRDKVLRMVEKGTIQKLRAQRNKEKAEERQWEAKAILQEEGDGREEKKEKSEETREGADRVEKRTGECEKWDEQAEGVGNLSDQMNAANCHTECNEEEDNPMDDAEPAPTVVFL